MFDSLNGNNMVVIVQLVEHQFVALRVMGPNPINHPKYGAVAQLVEQGPEEPRVGSSILSRTTK